MWALHTWHEDYGLSSCCFGDSIHNSHDRKGCTMLWFTSSNTPLVLQCLSVMNQNFVMKLVLLPLHIVKYLFSCQHILVWLVPWLEAKVKSQVYRIPIILYFTASKNRSDRVISVKMWTINFCLPLTFSFLFLKSKQGLVGSYFHTCPLISGTICQKPLKPLLGWIAFKAKLSNHLKGCDDCF